MKYIKSFVSFSDAKSASLYSPSLVCICDNGLSKLLVAKNDVIDTHMSITGDDINNIAVVGGAGNVGVGVGLISFTIDGIHFQAEQGMTWRMFINSVYNIPFDSDGGFDACIDGQNGYPHVENDVYGVKYIYAGTEQVLNLDDKIVSGESYIASDWVRGGSAF